MDPIFEKLTAMDGKLDELLLWKSVHTESHKSIDRDINEIREELFENPGIKTQVQTLMNGKKQINKSQDFWRSILRKVIETAIIAIIMWFMLMYKKGPDIHSVLPSNETQRQGSQRP